MGIREKLLEQLETVDGNALIPHYEREALIFVGGELDIVDVGVAFANDNKESVSAWLQSGDLQKCSEADKTAGALSKNITYQFLILQPFVLAKKSVPQ